MDESKSSRLKLVFVCSCSRTKWGETLKVVGSTVELGQWNIGSGVLLSTSNDLYPRWRSTIVEFGDANGLPSTIEFKFVITKKNDEDPKWENNCEPN